jgi:hypothetical protein
LRSHTLVPAIVLSLALQPASVFGESAADSLSIYPIETVLRRGDMVRLTYHDPKPQRVWGKVDRLDHSSVILDRYGEAATVPLHRITNVERKVGTKGNFGPAAAIGGLAGAALGTLYIVATSKAELGYVPANDVGTAFMMGAGVGIAVGGLLGATVLRSTVWEEVPVTDWRR